MWQNVWHTLKPVNTGGHAAYQKLVLEQLCKYYPNASSSLDASTWEIMEQFWSLDLTPVDEIMQDRYSVFGPEPRLPSNMLRSYLLSIKCKVPSITAWASDLKQNHLHAILSGFTFGDTPSVGTFYDFFDQLWLSDSDNISDPVHPPKQKPKKPDKKFPIATKFCISISLHHKTKITIKMHLYHFISRNNQVG